MIETMAYARCGRAHVALVHSQRNPKDEEWSRYLADLHRWVSVVRGVLVVSEGGGPTSGQRRAMHETFRLTNTMMTAVITESLFARGVVLAMNLWNPAIRAFSPVTIERGLDYIKVPTDERPSLLAEVARLRERLHG